DADAMAADLEGNWEVLGEAVQSVMRTLGVQGVPGLDNPYERLKDLTRGHRVDCAGMREFVRSLGLPEAEQERLLALSPHTYVACAPQLIEHPDAPPAWARPRTLLCRALSPPSGTRARARGCGVSRPRGGGGRWSPRPPRAGRAGRSRWRRRPSRGAGTSPTRTHRSPRRAARAACRCPPGRGGRS